MIESVQQKLAFIKNLKIPTLFGLGLVILGIATGVLLTFQEQILDIQAGPDTLPKNTTLSNIEDESVTISWITTNPSQGSVKYGINSPTEQTAIDIRDKDKPENHITHYVTIKNLTPQTNYQYKIVSNGKDSEKVSQFTTSALSNKQNGFKPVIGSVIENNQPLKEGIAYLSVPGGSLQSALVGPTGGFIIPIGKMRKQDLSNIFFPEEKVFSQIRVISTKGVATANFRLGDSEELIGTLKIGENSDFTIIDPKKILERFDLNNDQNINTSDYGIVLNNFGTSPKNPKADINKDGAVDQKDADLLIKQINAK